MSDGAAKAASSSGPAQAAPHFVTAREAGLVGCTVCGTPSRPERKRCPHCNAKLQSRPRSGTQAVWAWWVAGLIAYIPANIFPILLTRSLGQNYDSTIVGGAIELIQAGDLPVAMVILTASVAIPICKFLAVGLLALAVDRHWHFNRKTLLHLYEVVEFIGRWSMVDIFVVAILSALVQLGFLATLGPGPAAPCFAISVVCTMLAARAFDTRLIWDRIGDET